MERSCTVSKKSYTGKKAWDLVLKDPVLRVLFLGGLICAAIVWLIVLSI